MLIRRLIWLFVILVAIMLYITINRFVSGGYMLSLSIDTIIPLYPPALIPYLLASVLFVAFPIWASIYSKSGEFEAYVISILIATIISYIAYIVFPKFVIRPEVAGDDYFSNAMILLYQNDYPNNAAPSGHTFYTIISFLYIRRWKSRTQLIGIIVVIVILASTLLTKQHYLLDLVTGLVLSIIAYFAGRYIQNNWNLQFASLVHSDPSD